MVICYNNAKCLNDKTVYIPMTCQGSVCCLLVVLVLVSSSMVWQSPYITILDQTDTLLIMLSQTINWLKMQFLSLFFTGVSMPGVSTPLLACYLDSWLTGNLLRSEIQNIQMITACYRKHLPLTMKSCFYPLIGDKVCFQKLNFN